MLLCKNFAYVSALQDWHLCIVTVVHNGEYSTSPHLGICIHSIWKLLSMCFKTQVLYNISVMKSKLAKPLLSIVGICQSFRNPRIISNRSCITVSQGEKRKKKRLREGISVTGHLSYSRWTTLAFLTLKKVIESQMILFLQNLTSLSHWKILTAINMFEMDFTPQWGLFAEGIWKLWVLKYT